jgi:hypothetical protein
MDALIDFYIKTKSNSPSELFSLSAPEKKDERNESDEEASKEHTKDSNESPVISSQLKKLGPSEEIIELD